MVHAKMNSTEDNERCTTLKMVLRFVCSVLILGGHGLELRNPGTWHLNCTSFGPIEQQLCGKWGNKKPTDMGS